MRSLRKIRVNLYSRMLQEVPVCDKATRDVALVLSVVGGGGAVGVIDIISTWP